MRIRGLIHMIDLESKVIGIVKGKKIEFFYFQNSQMNLFKRYLYTDNWIDLEYDEEKMVKKNAYLAYVISYVYRLEAIGKNDRIIYYDKPAIKQSLSTFLNSMGNMMFLDLEMTMPSYSFKGKGQFRTEMIQAGAIIVNSDLKELDRYANYVEPKLERRITKRAEDFLHITEVEFYSKAILYEKFYEDFSSLLDEYNPAIVVFGRNDILVLNDSYDINNKPSLKNKCRFVNLCQLIKSYYELRNDPGLFKLYKVYYGIDYEQVHDAFEDSTVTMKVFEAFRKDVMGLTNNVDLIRTEFD